MGIMLLWTGLLYFLYTVLKTWWRFTVCDVLSSPFCASFSLFHLVILASHLSHLSLKTPSSSTALSPLMSPTLPATVSPSSPASSSSITWLYFSLLFFHLSFTPLLSLHLPLPLLTSTPPLTPLLWMSCTCYLSSLSVTSYLPSYPSSPRSSCSVICLSALAGSPCPLCYRNFSCWCFVIKTGGESLTGQKDLQTFSMLPSLLYLHQSDW